MVLGTFRMFFSKNKSTEVKHISVFQTPVSTSTIIPSTNKSKWERNKLVIIPAIWKEINWANQSSWPLWLRNGLDLFNNTSRLYDVHLYQRVDPNSKPPYDWPYCANVHEEAGVYLKFIHDYYHDLPDKMLFMHGNPFGHTRHPIELAQCVRDDVHFVNINNYWIKDRLWTVWPRDPADNIALGYKCARRLLTLLDFDAEAQLNPDNKVARDESLITTICCAQFYVTKERIRHYTHKQWSSLYNATLEPYCTTKLDQEIPGGQGHKYFGAAFEHLWHVILGLHPTNMPLPKNRTNTDRCHLFRSSCKGSPC